MTNKTQAITDIIAVGRRLRADGLICALSGNISCRLDDGSLLITASGVDKGNLEEADILPLDHQGRLVNISAESRPSSETPLHVALYQTCPQIKAIVHAHPPYATALACSELELDWRMLEEARLFLGAAPLIPPLNAGSAELALAAARAAAEANALLLAGHGAVSWGETLQQAAFRMEILEHTARVMLYKKLFQI